MMSVLPPKGLSEVDYETIEAAVTETVRGRWFLSEFARRNRTAEMRQLLDAMGRLESAVAAGQAALAPADPSVRLFMQRIKEVAGQLDRLSADMRAAGVAEQFASAVEKEARAVLGMVRSPSRSSGTLAGTVPSRSDPPQAQVPPLLEARRQDLASPKERVEPVSDGARSGEDPRLVALATLDELPLATKLALFS